MIKKLAIGIASLLHITVFCAAQQKDSLDIKIGQMILIGFPGQSVDRKVLEEVREGKVGSIIIFEKNIPPRNSFVELKKIVWTYQKAATIPLFVSIDQEGGKVNRLKDKYGFPRSITAQAMGSSTLDSVRFYGASTASTLAGLGINVNFAPVVDVATNPSNPVIVKNGRSFSPNADTVAIMAREFIVSHRKMGVVTVLKHFPGHGSSEKDTHLGIADVTNTWNALELEPYAALIAEGYVDAVMTGHIVNKKLDPDGNPGTLSKPVLDGILRKQLAFGGVIFSDDMQMHAITKHYGLEEAIRMAINAGVDVMCFSNNIAGSDNRTADVVHQIIRKLISTNQISKERIDESFRRIMKLKRFVVEDPTAYYDERISDLQSKILNLENKNVMLEKQVTELKEQVAALQEVPQKKKKRKKS